MKTKISVIGLILALTVSAIIITIPTTIAQAPTKATYAYIGAIPNPVGVNQEVLFHVGIFDSLTSTEYGWEGITVTVTKPDGSKETLGPYSTDATGGTGTVYVPTMAGTYTIQTHFPEQVIPADGGYAAPEGTTMQASDSEILELVVQTEAVPFYPTQPLPEEYWNRPIDAQLREWSTISGNWLLKEDYNLYAPYNDGPESAHILWAKTMTTGGLAGGEMDIHAMDCGDAYEGKFVDPVILNGKLYYPDGSSRDAWQRVVCVDLHTGEELWRKTLLDNRTIAFGQTFYWDSYNYHGVFDYLWVTAGSTWHAFDPFNGDLVYTMTNVPSGTPVFGSDGEILEYIVNTGQGWMALWNSSRVVSDAGSWRPQGNTYDAMDGIEWNITIATGLQGSPNRILQDTIIGTDIGRYGWYPRHTPIAIWAISTKPGEEGKLLYNTTWQPPAGNITIGFATASAEDNVFILSSKETRQFWGFNLKTGTEIWGPTDSEHYMNSFQITYGTNLPPPVWGYGVTTIAYGKLFCTSWGGIVYAYDVATGDLDWTYEAVDPYNEMLWGNAWPLRTLFITDGKIYVGHEEHSPISPKPRGAPTICLDVETGEMIWRIDGAFRQTEWGGRAIIGDSIIATQDTYDQRVYAIGKGPSETTVSIQNNIVTHGSTALVTGMVTDISPGTDDVTLTKRFPNGVPAVSDESMSDWMLYVYKQYARPTDAVGVQVKIEAYDPNGNYQDIGTTTTDAYGQFGLVIEPEIPGLYWIMATFEGSESYYGSQSTTYLQVEPAVTPATPIEPETEAPDTQTPDTQTPDTETPDTETPDTETPATEAPLISTEVAVIAAVAVACVIGVAAFWALRKRK
ncbi:MAG: hypothetical protein CW691_11920 [Candidatus Bathyarchaeum sp.]|nr:MAG: hypothetical protein CW691_11920 [Candidatus Bathyarchaeum sp.]